MDFRESPDDAAFRADQRAWLEGALDDDLRAGAAAPVGSEARTDASREWQRRLHAGGWIAPGWPRAWGGRDATAAQVAIFHEESALAGAPNPINAIGIWNIGPMLLAAGTEEQKRRWLPPMLSGDEIWCQGFSEPDAGSDLAALRTRAEPVEGGFSVTGHKLWTTNAHLAARCLALARTDPAARKHEGISALVIDMRAPGVEVRPIREITGDAGFNEIFLTDVFVPRDDLVGELNRGWETAISTLTHERMGTTTLGIRLRRELDDLIALARATGATRDPVLRATLADLHVGVESMRLIAMRALTTVVRGGDPTVLVALGKLQWSVLVQRIAETAVAVQGAAGLTWAGSARAAEDGRWQHRLLYSRMTTIGAGTTEIQKNILAQRGLGLPKAT